MLKEKILSFYRSIAYTRCDDDKTAFYFSAADFPNLCCDSLPFTAAAGHRLQGYVYYYNAPSNERLIVFDHGFGGGHRSYMKEIEMLCRRGYTVFAYDHTGCMESGGDSPNGLSQSLCDLNDCLSFLKSNPRFAGCDFSVMGHSWGGFAAMNITALHPDVSHVVALSGFLSPELLVYSIFGGILRPFAKEIMELEKAASPEFYDFNAFETLLEENRCKVLLIYSDNDVLCSKKASFDIFRNAFKEKKNITLLLEKKKGHNPNYTSDAVKLLGDYTSKKTRLSKKGKLSSSTEKEEFLASFDWDAMTKQDERVWNAIFDCLES